ncbi:MAG TPA: phosphoenolpyruvate--protein phosphotransferase [Nitrospirota bacterium]
MIKYNGIGVSSGIAIGKAFVIDRNRIPVTRLSIAEDEVPSELVRFKNAVATSKDQLKDIRKKLSADFGDEHGYILDTHMMILDDKMLINGTAEIIKNQLVNSEYALKEVLNRFISIFNAMGDAYLRERKIDIEHVGERVLRNLSGKKFETLSDVPEDAVVVAHDIAPSDTFQMRRDNVLAFVTDIGSNTSHTAIMARSLELAAVVGLESISKDVKTGDFIIVDGNQGVVVVNPDQDTFIDYLDRQRRFKYFEKELIKISKLPGMTLDGREVHLAANVEIPEDMDSILDHGAKGVGLFRTEFLFLNRQEMPTEEEHFQACKAIAEKMDPYTVVVRTFDLGGDKIPVPLPIKDEVNPALGLRAIRFSLMKKDIFKAQLRGILRASAFGNLKLMFPMISGVSEIRKAQEVVQEAMQELRAEKIPFNEDIDIGVMIEVPSAGVTADIIAKEAAFFSVGTNDLIQYTLAIDRTNEHVAYLYEPLHPAVLRFLHTIVDAGHKAGIPVAMCGEMAGEPLYSLVLMGLGFDELSMTPYSIPRMKKIIRQSTMAEAVELAKRALEFATAEESRNFVVQYMAERFPEDISSDGKLLY